MLVIVHQVEMVSFSNQRGKKHETQHSKSLTKSCQKMREVAECYHIFQESKTKLVQESWSSHTRDFCNNCFLPIKNMDKEGKQ